MYVMATHTFSCNGLNPASIIYVVGAGRGPIVARCLSAIERSGRAAFIYAVEKNPNAFVTYDFIYLWKNHI